jgi:dihydroorotate dehydrogenase (NAD+) catalytic subunit
MGGVETGRHALELLAAGANRVALGTVLFAEPGAVARIRAELVQETSQRGFASPGNATGAAHAPGRTAPEDVESTHPVSA